MEEIFGHIESIVFTESEKGFTVARMKEPKKRELTTIVGYFASLQPGESVRCKGAWKQHAQHGMQFDVASFELEAPSDLLGIQKYLESGMIKGIGRVYAERIVAKFGLATLEVIEKHPGEAFTDRGIGSKRLEKIVTCWGEQRAIRDVMIFLRGHGVSPGFAQKIFKAYGEASIEKVKANPYALAKEIHGVGFKSADSIAKGLGVPLESPHRIAAGIEHILWELSNEGHVCFPENELIPIVKEHLEVDLSLIQRELEALARNGDIVRQEGVIWVKPLYLSEVGIARELARLVQNPAQLRAVDLARAVEWVEKEMRIQLAPEQKEAVALGVKEKVLVITGGPGTGKSTITKAILAITSKLSNSVLLCAPTGRAAKRMSEITHKKAFTIHALLEMDFTNGGFKKNRDNPLTCALIIVDEASMIDTLLMNHLLKAIPDGARLILVGDIDQLPSVGPGNVLKDIISSEKIPVVRLMQIFRQAQGSRIVTNAHRINHGEFPDISPREKSDFHFIEKEEPEAIVEEILRLVQHELPKHFRLHRFEDIQVLSPMRRGLIGIENLNVALQKALNPCPTPFVSMGRSFHVGDKVMQIRNNYQKEVFNGDIGKIAEIDRAKI